MNTTTINLIDAVTETKNGPSGKPYVAMEVTYKDYQGKTATKKIMEFSVKTNGAKALWDKLLKSERGTSLSQQKRTNEDTSTGWKKQVQREQRKYIRQNKNQVLLALSHLPPDLRQRAVDHITETLNLRKNELLDSNTSSDSLVLNEPLKS